MVRRAVYGMSRALRRVVILVVGGAILLAGIAMIVLPGPAIVAIPAGLGVLSLEFEWAERWRHAAVERIRTGFRRGPVERKST